MALTDYFLSYACFYNFKKETKNIPTILKKNKENYSAGHENLKQLGFSIHLLLEGNYKFKITRLETN